MDTTLTIMVYFTSPVARYTLGNMKAAGHRVELTTAENSSTQLAKAPVSSVRW